MAIISVQNLTKTYTTFRKAEGLVGSLQSFFKREIIHKEAVRGVSFAIESNELVGFLGPNGAGKTTVMKILAGILHPTSGEVRVLDHIPWRREHAFLKRLALVMGQKAQLNWDLPAADSFLLNRDIYELEPSLYRSRVGELVELFEIKDVLHVPIRQLSLGERMKCELAASLLHSPELLLLDEPTIGLDVVSQKKLRVFLKTYQEQHRITILLTSHYMQDIQELCGRVIVINHGQVVFDDALSRLVEEVQQLRRLHLTFSSDQSASLSLLEKQLQNYGRIVQLTPWDVVLEVERRQSTQTLAGLISVFPIDDVSIEEAGIEEAITSLFTMGSGPVDAKHDAAASQGDAP